MAVYFEERERLLQQREQDKVNIRAPSPSSRVFYQLTPLWRGGMEPEEA